MIMQSRQLEEVAKQFECFWDEVLQKRPLLIQDGEEYVLAVNAAVWKEMLSGYRLTIEIRVQDDGSWVADIQELDLVSHGSGGDAWQVQVARDVLTYAQDYYADFPLYYRSHNRKGHLPYVMAVLIRSNEAEVSSMFDLIPSR